MANIKDGATGTVLTAPFPMSSGTSLTLNSGEGARFPAPPFWAIAGPNNGLPLVSVAEKILVTAVSTDTFTITRAPFGPYTAKNIDVGWRISNAIFQDDFNNASIIKNEVPAGTINGINTAFTLASAVHTAGTLEVYKNGIRLKGGGNDYTETATGFTMVTAPASTPVATVLLVDYIVTGAINNVGTNSQIFDETPVGTVNGVTALFTAARPYIPGSLRVFVGGTKQKRGIHFTETNPSLGTFTMSDAPIGGTVPNDLMIDYDFNLNPSGNTDTVDGIHASATPTANMLLALDNNALVPNSALGGVWTDWTPTITTSGTSITATAPVARYTRVGQTIIWQANIIISAASGGGNLAISAPIASKTSGVMTGCGREDNVVGKMLQAFFKPSASSISCVFYDNTATSVAGYSILMSGTYEAA